MIFFNLLSLILIKLSSENHVIYKFKKISNPTKTLMENILQNDLEISIYIGTPPQKVNLNLRSKSYAFFIAGSEVQLNLTKFNETKSSSYKKLIEKPTKFLNLEYSRGYKISESLLINNKIINDITLVLASELNYFESGALGLKLVYNHEFTDELSFIYQLKKLANFDNYGFYLKYDNDESGEIIIGTYPHLIDKNFKETDFMYKSVEIEKGNYVEWIIHFDFFKYDNQIIQNITLLNSFITIEFGLISAPLSTKEFFKNNYLNKITCYQSVIDKYYFYKCDINSKIENFKNISFLLKDIDYQFNLTYNDLFIKKGNDYLFTIVFNTDTNNTNWILGNVFLKKYQIIFDLDRKIIGIYINNDNLKHFNVTLILSIIFGLFCLFLIVYIFFYMKKPRRIRANELEDECYDYIPS